MQILLYIWLAGFLGMVLYRAFQFSQAIKVVRTWAFAVFMGMEVLKDLAKDLCWPWVLLISILQYPVAKKTVDDTNEAINEYLFGEVEEDTDKED